MKLQTEIERLLLAAAPGGLTHAELARMTCSPEPSVRRALQVIRAHAPRFKAGQGMFDVVVDPLLVDGRKKFLVQWRTAKAEETKSYTPEKVLVTFKDDDGKTHVIVPREGELFVREPGDFDSGSKEVA